MTDRIISRQPIIIIGAPRSGTNMLRDVLTKLPAVGTWPCDEINYLWRYGNATWPTDELEPAHASERVCQFIRTSLANLARRNSLDWVVEKTCANSLRVDYVQRVFPEAKFVFLVRDGRDAIASSVECWTRPPKLGYLSKKARYVPVRELPIYGARFLRSQLHRLTSQEKRWASWGPRFVGMDRLLATSSTAEVCAAQWSRCVKKALDGLSRVRPENQYHLRYEDFVNRPAEELATLTDRFHVAAEARDIAAAVSRVTPKHIGKWRRSIDERAMNHLVAAHEPLLTRFGYGTDASHVADRLVA